MDIMSDTDSHEANHMIEHIQSSRPITRRRGACKRCQARKVRCDGKPSCSQCLRHGYECRYPTTGHRKRTSTSSTFVPTSTYLQPPIIPIEIETTQDQSGSYPLQQLDTNLFGDIYTSDLSPHTRDVLSAHFDPFCNLDLDTIIGVSEQDAIDTNISCSTHATSEITFFPGSEEETSSTDIIQIPEQKRRPVLPRSISLPGNNMVVRGVTALNRMFADEEKPHVLVKEAVLEDIADYCNKTSSAQSQELLQVFKTVVSQDVNVSSSTRRGNASGSREAVRVDQGFISDCIEASLRDPQGISSFLDRTTIDSAVNQIGGQSTEALPDRGLGHVVLALGSYLLSAEASSKKCNTHDALLFFNAALNLKSDILQQSFSVQTFQYLVTMTYFASRIGLPEASSILSNCIHYAQVMRLSRSSAIESLCESTADQIHIKRSLWFLHSIEKILCLRAEIIPVLDGDFVDFQIPAAGEVTVNIDWLPYHCEYAGLCASILRNSYSQRSLQNQSSDNIDILENQLHLWFKTLPAELQCIDIDTEDFARSTSQERREKLLVFFRYHEALLAIRTKQGPHHLTSMPESTIWQPHRERGQMSSVMKILGLGCQITACDVRLDPAIYRLMCISTCILATSTIRNGGDRKELSYLATAAGFFGRMALADIEGPFEEITEIVRIAQQSIKERKDSGHWRAGD